MKLELMDICDTSTPAYKLLQQMTDRAKTLREEAERIEEVNRMLIYHIQEGKIDDVETIMCAISWLSHSTLEPHEILEKCPA